MDKNQIIEALKGMTILEINELVQACEEEFGVSAAAAVVAAPAAGGGEAAEEQTEFTVVLASAGDQKIKVIKAVRELVDGAPANVKENIEAGEANALKEALEAVGATVELK